ncbi:MAG: hypothetical protein ABIP75_06355 [Pyrinomonadaceae bacterium]
MKNKTRSEQPTRREFSRIVAAAGAAVLVPFTDFTTSAQNPSPSPTPVPTPPVAPVPSAAARALTEVAKARFGEYLTPEQQSKLPASMENLAASAGRLRAVKLKNADEPDFVFTA